MRFPALRRVSTDSRKDLGNPDPKGCQARIGIDKFCLNPALPGKKFCPFHNSLSGPWAKPDKVFKDI
jgi:hypothetical protein